ncbi:MULTISPECIES: anthranilate synthase component I family protein [Streptomyces]|uniref:anthranilate synthase component I family protein n=1 Tax=Streptomyces TaxID=1883 RepID=UPI0004CCAD4B|nr:MULTISPECIES: anthranilate synthase component I family protein [Streptomyces]KOT52804.1 anthranilate synthase [Streptomyces rimosus subsp. rimosus]
MPGMTPVAPAEKAPEHAPEARPQRADPRFSVRVATVPLPGHDPLALYRALTAAAGHGETFLTESLAGPRADRRPAVVGHGRLAEIRLFAGHVEIDGSGPLRHALGAAAEQAGLTPDATGRGPYDRYRLARSDQAWQLLCAAQEMFRVERDTPGGYAFGFLATLGYEAAWHMEPLPARTASRGGPDLTATLFRETVWYDHEAGTARLLTAGCADFPPAGAVDVTALARRAAETPSDAAACPDAPAPLSVRDSVARADFLRWAERCLEHIRIGDIYQIQIGHRIDVRSTLRPDQVYQRLRARNPSPYMYLCPRGTGTLIGASPELHFRIEPETGGPDGPGPGAADGARIVMRPIAGTTRRTPDPEENERRIEEMVTSSKERAEHVMLVDLCRNDIGRVARAGSLDESGLMTVETFSHVFHMVSTVGGRLAPGAGVWDAMAATFPAGTMTGAPKLRAMEIIDGIEEEPRGSYAGAVGLVDVAGWAEFALCIRTVVHDGEVYSTQSSAGIVAESTPEAEWNETLAKMAAAHWALTGSELL